MKVKEYGNSQALIIRGYNFCRRYHQEVDDNLVHSIARFCELRAKYGGCAKCPLSEYREIKG